MLPPAQNSLQRRRLLTGIVATTVVAAAAASGPAAFAASSSDLGSLVSGTKSGSTLSLASGSYTFKDFTEHSHGVDLGDVGLKGAGVDKTVLEMVAHSSTKAGSVPTATGSTNPLYLLYTAGGTPGLSGFTLAGTAQGHLYGGLFVGQTSNARVSNVKITDIPGNSNQPPGETFSLNDYDTTGSVYSNLEIDGDNGSAVDFGSNSSTNITVSSSTFTGTEYSSGMALWQTKNITLNDITLKNNRSGINFEHSSGTITINEPVLSSNRLYDFQFGTNGSSAKVTINNPVLTGESKIRIQCPLKYHGGTNGQKRSDIHVIVNGVDKTSSLVQFL